MNEPVVPSAPPAPHSVAAIETPLQQTLRAGLANPAIVKLPAPARFVKRAIALAERGLDHIGNESLVAIAQEKIDDKRGSAILVTDRRVFGNSGANLFSLPYEAITGCTRRGDIMGQFFRFLTGDKHLEVEASLATALLEPFLGALGQLSAAERRVERRPLATPTADDPIGAAQIRAKLLSPDAHTSMGVSYLERLHARGWLDAEGAMNALKRLLLLNRTQWMGRGMIQGLWFSPCTTQDLAHGFASIFGYPSWQGSQGAAILLDFKNFAKRFPAAHDDSLSLRAHVRQSIDEARLTVTPVDQLGCAFKLEDKAALSAGLDASVVGRNARLWQAIDETLVPYETQITQLRTVLGWNMQAAELLARGPAMCAEAIHRVMGDGGAAS